MIDNCFHHHHHSAVVETFTNQIDNCLKSELVQMRSAWSFRSNWNSWNFITVISNTIQIIFIDYFFSQTKLSFQKKRCRDWQNFTAHFVVVNLKVVLMYIQLWAGEVSDFKLAPQRPHDISMQSKTHRNLEMSLKYPICWELYALIMMNMS